jgi:cytochrome c peroxidase
MKLKLNQIVSKYVAFTFLATFAVACGNKEETKHSGSGDAQKNSPVQSEIESPVQTKPDVKPNPEIPQPLSPQENLRSLLAAQNIKPIENADFRQHSEAKVRLGQVLFFDRILSGNRTVSCATCHIANRGSVDHFALPIDPASRGLVRRLNRPSTANFVPRNTIGLSNIGHKSFKAMFHDSRVALDPAAPSGFSTPAGAETPLGLDSVVAAQALFPLLSDVEMLGAPGENDLADLTSPTEIWSGILDRVLSYREYRNLFFQAYPLQDPSAFGIEHLANAIAAFEETAFRSDKSRFDSFLNGNNQSLNPLQLKGATLFYANNRCSGCHSGVLQTNNAHFAIGIPQFGPGKGHGIEGLEDFGRGAVTGKAEDMYKFRVPSLRNVALSAPYGHTGAYTKIESYIKHYRDPVAGLNNWDPTQVQIQPKRFPRDFFEAWQNPVARQNLIKANQIPGIPMTDDEVVALSAFMGALTDDSFDIERLRPTHVPSGKRDFLGFLSELNQTLNEQIRMNLPLDLDISFFD